MEKIKNVPNHEPDINVIQEIPFYTWAIDGFLYPEILLSSPFWGCLGCDHKTWLLTIHMPCLLA